MNKTELVNAMATKATMTKAGANAAVDAFTQIITERLQKGEKVSLIGFGTFEYRFLFHPIVVYTHIRIPTC